MKNKIIAATAVGVLAAVGFAAPALATDEIAADPVVCYETVTHTEVTWDKQKWRIVTPAVPEVPAVPAIPATPDTYAPLYDYSETRATGHFEATAPGLHIWTEGATSTDKVALYRVVNVPLTSVTSASVDYTATTGITPGSQVVVDISGDGVADGILVNEPVYGDVAWLSNSATAEFKAGAPHVGGGYGSENYGTLTEWGTAFPTATVVAIGFSLGSGVLGDGVVHSVNGYSFVSTTPGTPEVPEVPAIPAVPAIYGWVTVDSGQGLELPNAHYGKQYVQTGTVEVSTEVETECPVVEPEPEETVTPTPQPEESSTPLPVAAKADAALATTGMNEVVLPIGIAAGVALLAGTVVLVIHRRRAAQR